MYESEAEIAALQALLDRSYERAGAHTRSIITPERRLSARQLVAYLQGTRHVAVGTVTSKGEPRVAPVDGHFLHGRFYFGTSENALRIQHLRRNRAISLCHVVGDEIGVVVHGRAVLLGGEGPEAKELRDHYARAYGSDPESWAEGIAWVRVEAQIMTTFALEPSRFPE